MNITFKSNQMLLMFIGIVYGLPTLLVLAFGMIAFSQPINALILAISVPFTVFSMSKMIDTFGYGLDNVPPDLLGKAIVSALIAILLISLTV